MRVALIILCLLLGACGRVSDTAKEMPPPSAYLHASDRLAAQMLHWGIPWRFPCLKAPTVEQCFKFTQPERMQGLWRNNLEDSEFCAAPARQCPEGQSHTAFDLKPPPGYEDTPPGGLYAVDFVGRRADYGGGEILTLPDVVVDRLISIKEVEAPAPGQMTKEVVEAYLKECRAVRICMPNSEVTRANGRGIHYWVPEDHPTIE